MRFKTAFFAAAISASFISTAVNAQDMFSPEKGMSDPIPAGAPASIELTGKAMQDISQKLVEKFAVPPAIFMSYDPLTKLIMVNTMNGPIIYTNRDTDFLMGKTQDGKVGLYTNFKGKIEDRSEAMARPFVIAQMASLNDPIVYKAPNEKYRVTVFVEPTCGYCYKLHTEMESYHAEGITLEYVPYPIYGELSDLTMARIWSLPKSEQAAKLTEVKTYLMTHRNEIRDKSPADVLAQFNLPEVSVAANEFLQASKSVGQNLQIAGTPAIVLENGRVLGGYLPADALKGILEDSGQ